MKIFSSRQTVSKQLQTAFESEYKLSAKSFPNVLNLLSHRLMSMCNIIKSANSETNLMTTASSLRTRLSYLDKAIKEILARNKNTSGVPLIQYVDKDTDFNNMMYGFIKKYLNFYTEDDDIYDILVSAFTDVFLENFKKIFKEFDGTLVDEQGQLLTNTDGTPLKVKIEPYIHTMLKRAVIKHSKILSENYGKRHHINPFEDESEEDAFDRAVEGHVGKFDHRDQLLYDQLVKALKGKFKRDSNPARVEKIFDLLVMGYAKGDIAKEIGVSGTRVGDYVWHLKTLVEEVANDLHLKGDSDLLTTLEKTFKK